MKRIKTLKAVDDALDLQIYMESTYPGIIEIDFKLEIYEESVTQNFQDNVYNFIINIIKDMATIVDEDLNYRNMWEEDAEAGYPADTIDFFIKIKDDDAGQELMRKWIEVGGQ